MHERPSSAVSISLESGGIEGPTNAPAGTESDGSEWEDNENI